MKAILRYLYPPYGCQVRRVVAWTLLAYGIVSISGLPTVGHDASAILPWFLYGWLKVVIAGALLLTNMKKRTTWYGRIISALAFALCVTLAVDAYPAWNGVATYVVLSMFLLVEAATRHECP